MTVIRIVQRVRSLKLQDHHVTGICENNSAAKAEWSLRTLSLTWQESIPGRCQPHACRPYVLLNEQLWIWSGEGGGPCAVRSKLKKLEQVLGSLYRTSALGSCIGVLLRGPCKGTGALYRVQSDASWVIVTWGPLMNIMTNRQDWKHYYGKGGTAETYK